ncbi:MAG: hypothetical protein IPK01_01140 [Acidobacteria bacterium]|nr:hypothetical protein [Acidobacteriota bacterium]
MRTLVPAETLVYLETNDLAAALQPIVDAKPFMEAAKRKPDLSALKGVQLAVAVTGFETREEKLTDEHSVGRVQPRFVAIADTHAWNSNAVTFAEKKLGSFVANIYDSEPTVEKTDKNGGKYFTWTATDGRKAYALVIDSIIYFGNDEPAIEKCLAVKRGETDSILKTGKVPVTDRTTLAQGYVSTDGIAQIAALAGLKFASEAADESEVQSAIAGILPKLIRNSITEISWTSINTEKGIEDKYTIGMPPDITAVFAETMAPGDANTEGLNQLPLDSTSVTVYNLKQPQIAWRSLLLIAQKAADPVSGQVILEFGGLFFEPYGVRSPEVFLSAVGSTLITTKFGADGEQPVVIASVTDPNKVRSSFLEGLKPDKEPFGIANVEHWTEADGDIAAGFAGGSVLVGDNEGVTKCLDEKPNGGFRTTPNGKLFDKKNAAVMTFGIETANILRLVEMLAREQQGDIRSVSTYFTETRFTKTGIDRRTTSDFGLIGSIIAQLNGDE